MPNVAKTPLSRERGVIIGSSLVTILGGCTSVFMRWQLRHQPIDGFLRCVTLVSAMIATHVWGFEACRNQGEGSLLNIIGGMFRRNARQFWRAKCVGVALVQQLILLVFSNAVLDGGQLMALCASSIAVFWLVVGFAEHRVAPQGFEMALFLG